MTLAENQSWVRLTQRCQHRIKREVQSFLGSQLYREMPLYQDSQSCKEPATLQFQDSCLLSPELLTQPSQPSQATPLQSPTPQLQEPLSTTSQIQHTTEALLRLPSPQRHPLQTHPSQSPRISHQPSSVLRSARTYSTTLLFSSQLRTARSTTLSPGNSFSTLPSQTQ